MNRVTCASM